MKELNVVLTELGISKVRLAKYLGVSRQMLYNYLAIENLNDWPKEKAAKLLSLLNIENIEKLNEQERNSSLRVFVVENATQERLANVTMRVEEIESGYYGYYTTEEDGIAYINKIASGEAKITIVEVPDEYILNDTEYIIKIKAQDKSGVQELKFTKAILDVGKEVKIKYSEK